jgi:spore coat polysaccharide biosynthesis protein SpsF
MTSLLNILTVRTGSERLPFKALAEITGNDENGRRIKLPLTAWIIRRLRQMSTATTVLATTTDPGDDELVKLATREGIEVFRGSPDDVVGRMQMVLDSGRYNPRFVFRALGDCPFLDTTMVEYGANKLDVTGKDAMLFCLDPEIWPVYGAREFPYSRKAWDKIATQTKEREHPDAYFHLNRREFNVLYHIQPDNIYFRQSYRLEVDYPEDLEMVKAVALGPGMLAPLKDIIKFLDNNPDIARLNIDCIEKTGPLNLNTYSNKDRRQWLIQMTGKPVMDWDGQTIQPPGKKAAPVLCRCGALMGFGASSIFYSRDKAIRMERGHVTCKECGSIRNWR